MTSVTDAAQYAITTTFQPPAICTQSQFTMLALQQYFVYINYPIPVPSTTFTECYPSQFMSSWLSQRSETTPLPSIAPLICPKGYQTVQVANQPDGYVACCPSGMGLATSTQAPFDRPAFNGTCYLDISTIRVTAYGTSEVTTTSTWIAPKGAQAYALPIEGYAFVAESGSASQSNSGSTTPTSSPATTLLPSASPGSSLSSSPSQTSSSSPSSSSSSKTGAIVGGTIGGIAGLALILGLLFFLLVLRPRRKAAASQKQIGSDGTGSELPAERERSEMAGAHDQKPWQGSAYGRDEVYAYNKAPAELDGTDHVIPELDSANRERFPEKK